jgi:hypothetical protein
MVVIYFKVVVLNVSDKKVLSMRTKSWVGGSIGKLKNIKDDLLSLLNHEGDQIIKDRIAEEKKKQQRKQPGV